ncbi:MULTISPECIES: cupin domain-containing protein [unclassified Erythrobacter]|jgi:quercetin dioxygenase-like cupin family protein|uniref:cupin domain-containing protein n=1 Tax=unclassified Erythrobacter TaxID=2633097 RepID=UPI00076CD939|nr:MULTISPECIES: cupin domain-containing protein [unclassified Erythrobacter]KWV95009.1 cupin [Erythrobacter sp. AP23]MBO6527605.1 cupin domain-containing protein [Erythrobacter sp.]MBO6530140.1 cupin domain-containing protein [Erythrobacter sp.]
MTGPRRLADSFIHLGLGATAVPQPPFDGMEWYEAYGQRHGADGREGRLVSQHTFTEGWPSWEMHPLGDEVVICIAGEMVLTQEFPGGRRESVTLTAGEYAINPPGVWHIADVEDEASAIFITAGEGTQHRPR